MFRFYSNSFGQISKGFAKGLFVIGLLLIGFGTLVWVLKEIFAFIAAGIFMLAGVACCINAAKVYFSAAARNSNQNETQRDNVRIRIENNEL